MDRYDDFALNPQNFEIMAKEYTNKIQASAFKVRADDANQEAEKKLFANLEYLRVLIYDLKKHTSNKDILLVLDEIKSSVEEKTAVLKTMFKEGISTMDTDDFHLEMFCNNLKLAIQTTGEIVKILVQIKDDDKTKAEAKLSLTDIINEFIDINNNLVSLFGECRYLQYKNR